MRVFQDDVMRREYAQAEDEVRMRGFGRVLLAFTGQNVRHDNSSMALNYCGAGVEKAHTVSRKTQGKHGK